MAERQFIPVDPYEVPSNNATKDDAFYAGFSNSTPMEPLEAIETIDREIELDGYSITLENAKRTWELEQDMFSKQTINALIEDTEVDLATKKIMLDEYVNTKKVPLSLKEKYINQINDDYLISNRLEGNDAAILNEDEKIEELKVEQAKEKIDEKLEDKLTPNTPPQEVVKDNFNFIGLALELPVRPANAKPEPMIDIINKVISSPLALIDGMVGLLPWGLDTVKALTGNIDYYVANQAYQEVYSELNEATKKELRSKGINNDLTFISSTNKQNIPDYILVESTKRAEEIKKKLIAKYGDKVDTVTAMYEYLQEEFNKDPKKMSLWLGKQQELKQKLGIADDLEQSYLAQFFKSIFEQIDKAGQVVDPNDPKRFALLGELFVAIFGPKVVKSTYKYGKNKSYQALRNYADKRVAAREAKQKKMDERAIEKFPDEKVVEGEVISTPPPPPPKGGPNVNIKMNSPIATSTAINPKVGNSIFSTFMQAPEVGPNVGLNLQSFLHQSLDGNGTLVGTNQIGSQMDFRLIPEVLVAAERQREIQALDSNDVYYQEKIDFISQINDTRNSINNVKVDVPIVVSPTFSTSVPLPNAVGWYQSTVIRKSSTENYNNIQDATSAYNAVEKVILQNREFPEGVTPALEPGELVIERVVPAGTNAWNLIDSFEPNKYTTSDGVEYQITYKPTGKTKDGKPVKALVNYTKQEIIVDKALIEKSFPLDTTDWRFFLDEGKIIGRNIKNVQQQKDIKALENKSAFELEIKNRNEYTRLALLHEIAHSENPKQAGESQNAYEERMTMIAYEQFKAAEGSSYIVRWTKEMNQTQMVLSDFYDSYGTVPSKRTNKIDAAIQNIFSTKVSGGAAGNIGQVSEIITPYGQFTEAFESIEGGYAERIQFHRNVLKDKVIQRVLVDLSAKQQKMLAAVIEHGQRVGADTLSVGEIRTVLNRYKPQFGTPQNKTLEKVKIGLDSLRILANQDFVTANLIRSDILRKGGYDKAFYVTNHVTGVTTVLPVMENVILHRNDALYSEGGQPLSNEDGTVMTHQAFALGSNRPVEFTPNVRDFMQKDGLFIYENGMRTHQVYRVSDTYIDKDGHTYDYIIYEGLKPSELPTITLPRIPGYFPVIQKNSRFGVKYPLSHIHNGREVGIVKDPETGDIIKLNELDYGDEFYGKLTAEQQSNRDMLQTVMDRYSKTVVGRETRNELEEWHLRNPDASPKQIVDKESGEIITTPGEYIYIFKKASDLSTRDIKGYYETMNQETSTSKYRNEYLDSTIVEDPFRSLITTSNQINANFATQQFLKQAEDIFVKLYVDPGPKSKVTVIPNAEHVSTTQAQRNTLDIINDNFPFDRSQIRIKGDNIEDYKQALRMYDKIRLSRYGQGTALTANIIRAGMEITKDSIESNIIRKVLPERMADNLVVGLSKGQRYADVAVKIPSSAAMSLMILMKPFRQIFIQAPIFMTGLIVSSNYNPLMIARNLKDIMHLTAVQGLHGFWRDNPAYLEMQKYVWESDRALPSELKGEKISDVGYQKVYDIKFTNKDIEFINQMRTEIMGSLSQHEWLGSVFTRDMSTLGNPRSSTQLIDIINPKSYLSNFQKLLAQGFKGGEGLGRNGYIIIALRNWMYKNPELASRWKEQKHVNQWMQDALKGVGWMTGSRRLLPQKLLPIEFLTKFEAFGAKQSLILFNEAASGFKGQRRWEYIATGLLLLGTTPYAFHEYGPDKQYIKEMIIYMMEKMGFEEEAKEFDKQYLHLNIVDILGNMWANNGEDLEDEEKDEAILNFGESLNAYGFADYPFYIISRVAEYIGLTGDNAGDPSLLGAGFANIRALFGENRGFNLMLDFWTPSKPLTMEERLAGTASIIFDVLPFLKPFEKEVAERYLGDRYTKTGQPTGTGTNESEAFIVNILGVQDYATNFVFDSKKYSRKKQEMFLSSAQNFLVMLNYIAKRKPDYKGTPTWNDVKSLIDKWTIELEGRDFISGTNEHYEFKSQVRRLMIKQEKSLMKELYIAFIEKSNPNAKYYSEEDMKKVKELYEHYSKKYPAERDKILYRYNFMKERNRQYKLLEEGK